MPFSLSTCRVKFLPDRRQLLTKQWSGNNCSDAPTKIQTSSYAMDHRDWSGKQWRAERQACRCTRLTACFSQTFKPSKGLFYYIFSFYVSFLFQNSTYYVDKTIFVNMSFLKIALLLPVLLTKRLSNDSALRDTHVISIVMSVFLVHVHVNCCIAPIVFSCCILS